MRKILICAALIAVVAVISGCETTKGIGRDISNVGNVMSGGEPQNVTY